MQNNQMKNTEGTYGDKYKDHFFEQYKIYLQGIEKISDRRENANKYFVTINSGIIVALSYLSQHFNNIFVIPAMLSVLILGIVLSVIFYLFLNAPHRKAVCTIEVVCGVHAATRIVA